MSVSEVDAPLARRAAGLIQVVLDSGGRAHPSAIDAIVAAEAEGSGAGVLFHGDRADFEALAAASGGLEVQPLSGLV